MKKTTFFNSDENRIEKAKRWLHIVTVCFLLFLGQAGFSQSVATQTFNFNGYDDAGTQFSILPANINVNEGQAIQQITIVGFEGHYNSTTGSDGCSSTSPDEYDWFSFNLSVTGGEADGTALSGVCGDAIIDTDVTNFSNITISINDTDDWGDMVYFNITFEVTYETPTCPKPIGVVVANVTAYDADVSWDESLSEFTIGYEYVVSTSNTVPEGSGTPTQDGNTFVELEGLLNPTTTYYFFVRGVCENDEYSDWSSPISFTTGCVSVSTFPFVETFNTDSTSRQCWTAINGNSDTYTWVYGTIIPRSGESAQLYTDFTGSNNDYLVTPHLSLDSTPKRLKFWVRHRSDGEPENLNVRVSTTGKAIVDFSDVLLTLSTTQITTTYTEYKVDLSDYVDSDIYIAFAREDEPQNGWYLAIDDVTIEDSPTCPDQTGLVVANITSEEASISWDDMSTGGAIGYEYAITTSETPPASGTPTDETFVDATGLTPNTLHYLHVRSNCDVDGFGIWATMSFTTACVSVSTFPFVETFNTDSASRQCWTAINGNSDTYTWVYGTYIPRSGESAQLYTDFAGSNNDYLVTPHLNLGSTPKRLKFWVRHQSNGEPENLNVRVSTTGKEITDFTDVLLTLSTTQITTTYTQHVIDLSDYADSDVYIAFAREDEPHNGWYLAIDDVIIEDIPGCPDQTGLVVSDITYNSANLSWDDMADSGVIGYEYVVTTSATPPVSGEEIQLTYYEANGLDSNTTYYLHVRTICGDDSLGVWATLLFKTQVAPSTIPWVEGFTTTTALGWNVNNYTIDAANALIGGWPGSPKFGDGSTNIIRRNPFEYSSTGNFTTNSVGLVEEGNVLSFDYKLINYSLGDDNPPAEGSGYFIVEVSTDFGDTYQLVEQIDNNGLGGWQPKTISLDDFAGDYVKIRITDTWNSGDYYIGFDNFYIGVPPTCPTVTGLVVSNITSQSADTSWNDMSEEGVTAYEYAITTSATPPASGDGEPILDTFYEASGLEDNTVYYLHVRANCDDDLGNWATTSFTTQVAPSAIPWTEGFDTTTAPGWLANGYTLELASASIGSPSAVKFGDGTTRIVRRNPWSLSTTGNFTSNSVGVVSAGDILSFDYKLINYGNANAPAANSGSFKVEISTDFGATYELLETVVNNGIAGWQNEVYELDEYVGDYVRIKITDTWTSGDYFIGFDNFYIGQELSNPQFDKSALKVYPNPTKNILFVTYSQEISNVEIYNLVGQRVVTIAPNANEGQIDMSNLASGAYFVKVTSNNTSKTVKVIKE